MDDFRFDFPLDEEHTLKVRGSSLYLVAIDPRTGGELELLGPVEVDRGTLARLAEELVKAVRS